MFIDVFMFGIPINAMVFVTIERYVWPAWQSQFRIIHASIKINI